MHISFDTYAVHIYITNPYNTIILMITNQESSKVCYHIIFLLFDYGLVDTCYIGAYVRCKYAEKKSFPYFFSGYCKV